MTLDIDLQGIISGGMARVLAFRGERRVGLVSSRQVFRSSVSDLCVDIETLEVETGRSLTSLWAVHASEVEPSLRGYGLGVALYSTLVELVAQNVPEAVVLADACTGQGTSMQAQRVWESRDLAQVVLVAGSAATTSTGPERWTSQSPILERHIQLHEPAWGLKESLMPPG